jgi:hypothetical protein
VPGSSDILGCPLSLIQVNKLTSAWQTIL